MHLKDKKKKKYTVQFPAGYIKMLLEEAMLSGHDLHF